MKIKVLKSFKEKLNHQMEYIARDKPRAARKFKTDILQRIKELPQMPYKNRKSIYFDRDDIRDLIYKGYTEVYKINKIEDSIEVFGFKNMKTIRLWINPLNNKNFNQLLVLKPKDF